MDKSDGVTVVVGGIILALLVAFGVYAVIIVLGLFIAPLVMVAWNNSVLVTVWELPLIGYWEAFWTYLLASFLVKSTQTNNNKKD
jgi:hypothetical protein